jgi:hypothetical protein
MAAWIIKILFYGISVPENVGIKLEARARIT